MDYTWIARIPFPREDWAKICLSSLVVDTELREELVEVRFRLQSQE